MRTDLLSLNPGRAMAQDSHAANQFVHEHGKKPEVKSWQKDANGFGTVIVLGTNRVQITEIIQTASFHLVPANYVFDPTYNYVVPAELEDCMDSKTFTAPPIRKDNGTIVFFRKELTCAYLFLEESSIYREKLLGGLSLHP